MILLDNHLYWANSKKDLKTQNSGLATHSKKYKERAKYTKEKSFYVYFQKISHKITFYARLVPETKFLRSKRLFGHPY